MFSPIKKKDIFERLLLVILLPALFYFLYKTLAYMKNAPFVDFKCYYYAAKQCLNMLPVYPNDQGYLYPLFFSLLISPLALVNEVVAQYIWTIINIVAFFLSLHIIIKALDINAKSYKKVFYLLSLIISLTFRPVVSDLNHGQVNLIIMLLIATSWYYYKQNKFNLSSVFVALGSVIKVTPIIFLVYYLLEKRYRAAIMFCMFSLFLILIPSLKFGIINNAVQTKAWYNQVIMPYVNRVETPVSFENQSFASVIKRYCSQINSSYADPIIIGMFDFTDKQTKIVTIVFLGLILMNTSLILWRRRGNPIYIDFKFSLIILTMLLVSGISWIYHFVLLLIPILVLLKKAFEDKSFSAALITTFALLLINGTTKSVVGTYNSMVFAAYGSIFWAGFFLYIYVTLLIWSDQIISEKNMKKRYFFNTLLPFRW